MTDWRERSIEARALGTERLTLIFAWLAVVFVLTLAAAPLRPYFAEWRTVQARYNERAAAVGAAPIPIAIQQIWKPQLGVTDRCVTCHLGMGTAAPVPGEPLFAAHPPIPHDPRELGCTVCHAGQGRATTKDAAHGFVSHWDEQLLDVGHQTAGCGTCHDAVPLVASRDLARAAALVDSLDCLSCHRVDGRGRGTGPDLTHAGLVGYQPDWHAAHLAERARDTTGTWQASYGEIAPHELALVEAFLRTRVGAPRIVAAQALAFERGCLGCHKIAGRGGDEAPALDEIGRKPIGDLDFGGVAGARTLVNYMRQHLLDPPGIVRGSLMPPQAETLEQADLLTSYLLFLRKRALPASALPQERIRRELLAERPAPLSGEEAFGAYCSGCHNARGEGRNYGNLDVRFPAIGTADFLDVASDAFLVRTLQAGRPGRRMPALGAAGGSLTAAEVDALVAYLRTLAPPPASPDEAERAAPDRDLGARVYRADCQSCHGPAGEGTPLGSPLASADRRIRSGRRAVYDVLARGVEETTMAAYRAYDARTLRSLADYVLALPDIPGSRRSWTPAAGRAADGRGLYERTCAGCHGMNGEGKNAPALANSGFRQAATPAYVAATIVRGRAGTPMPAFGRDSVSYPRLTAQEVLDVAAYVLDGLGRTGEDTNGR